ncbi:molybdopterin cofactor-binding domain-containing protein [Tardiphaga sp.]|uniref:molybdopterin cofactor-binding domain-containing protein n=1 Tax=Tardiphaga sp. TaxID=1926292 RepID=UPI0037D9EB4D
MTAPQDMPASEYWSNGDVLLVYRETPEVNELYIAVYPDGSVTAFNGHVDLGTGIRTSLAQIVAEELHVPFGNVTMVLGSTTAAPNQGATIASETIQITAVPLRLAAATAREYLFAQAAERLGTQPDKLRLTEDGTFRLDPAKDPAADSANLFVALADLIKGRALRLPLDPDAKLKPTADYTIVGQRQARTDIPQKATGDFHYVHDVRVPGMAHGRVVRPPYAGFDAGPHIGHSLISVDESSVAGIPGLIGVVVLGDFVGVVGEREEHAIRAMKALKVTWRAPPIIPDLNAPEMPLRNNRSTLRVLTDKGDVETTLKGSTSSFERSYVWPYQMHGSIGPSCAVADWQDDHLVVWSGTQNPFPVRADLARLMDIPEDSIVVERQEAAGCYGRNCADDVTLDAALLSRAVRRPVRVQLTREQEHAWEPKGAAQVIDVRGALDDEGGPAAYDFETRYPSNLAPSLPLILTGKVPPIADVAEMGDRTAIPPYMISNMRVRVHDMPPIARASWFRGVSAMPNSFAHESFIDELAVAAEVDPIEYRLRYLTDPRAIDLIRAVAERAGWQPHTGPFSHGSSGDILYGRGFAYAVYIHGKFPGKAAAWAAWVADVAVNKVTGEIAVTRVVCGQDTGQVINPDGVKHQIHGNIIQSTSRVLKEEVQFSQTGVASLEWGAYPILKFPDVPDIDVLLVPRQDEEPLGAGESASVPSAAAITNAIFDATGVRFRELPLTPEKVRAALNPLPPPELAEPPVASAKRRWMWPLAGAFAGALATGAAILPWASAISPIARPSADTYSQATIERGRLAAAIGACNVCHIGNDGMPFGGGRALETPFGTVYASNITPDSTAGIGNWSYPAFERAMRQGVSREGHHLYPAHPYTSFAKASEPDLQALYAFLMTQTASSTVAPRTELKFPFNIRSLMAGWNALFLSGSPAPADASRSPEWNRGAELVEGLGHCSACHSPRNAVGAEAKRAAHLAGGFADGWDAHALTSASPSPIGWTQQALYDYLRTGRSYDHGSAAGPMAHVIESLQPLPDADIHAMATYLASFNETTAASATPEAVIAASEKAAPNAGLREPVGARIFDGACAACHGSDSRIASLALNTNLHATTPNNVISAIHQGIPLPVGTPDETMAMPAFAGSLDGQSTAALVRYLRARFAPDKAPWQNVDTAVAAGEATSAKQSAVKTH